MVEAGKRVLMYNYGRAQLALMAFGQQLHGMEMSD
jgi:hypothetical protein